MVVVDVLDAPSKTTSVTRRRPGQMVARLAHAAFVVAIAAFIVVPALPHDWTNPVAKTLAQWQLLVSVKQSWRMYAPNPQRAQMYMNLDAVYEDGSTRELEESVQERGGWDTHWLWDKTRVDIWRQYANFGPKRRNDNRSWYLKGVCVREARRGEIPHRIVMYQVRRRFTPPEQVWRGRPALGRPRRQLVTVAYCKTKEVLEMIGQDRRHRGQEVGDG